MTDDNPRRTELLWYAHLKVLFKAGDVTVATPREEILRMKAEFMAEERQPRDLAWRINLNDDNTVDEVVMHNAYVHLEDLGGAYMLIVENEQQHIHVTIPSPRFARKGGRAWLDEQYDPKETQ